MIINKKKYIQNYLYITTKDNEVKLLQLNQPQQMLYDVLRKQAEEGKPKRVIILKARQQGMTTITAGLIFEDTATKPNISSAIVAHDAESTNKIFGMYKKFYDNLVPELQPSVKYSNAKELVFGELNSSIRCMTAGSDGIGRGSTITNLHISEYAFWGGNKVDVMTGLLQAVPNNENTTVIIESTANGYDDFKSRWDAAVNGESDFYPLFIAWYQLDEYRMPYTNFELTQEEKELKDKFNLDNEQITWRRWCIANNCGGDIDVFRQEYPSTPEEAFISTGESYFNKELVVNQIERVRRLKPLKVGFFTYKKKIHENGEKDLTETRFIEDTQGFIRIYKQPEENVPYVIGADTAGEGSDKYTAQVINNITGEQVAVLEKQKIDEDEFAEQIVSLARHYNNALLSVEVNFNGYVSKMIELMNYDKQYIRESYDNSMELKYQKKYGFKTTSITRPQILAELKTIFRENPSLIVDHNTLQEMLVFIVNDKGRAEAMIGKHDDLVMALAIAYGTRYQQETKVKQDDTKKKNNAWWMLEDNEEEKEEWGDYY